MGRGEPASGTSAIRLVVAHDQPIFRAGLRASLEACADIEIVGEASSGEEAVDLCPRVGPEVVLIRPFRRGMDELTATALIRDRCPEVHVVSIGVRNRDGLVDRALQAGIAGFVRKDASGDELAAVVRAVANGYSVLPPEATQDLVRRTPREGPEQGGPSPALLTKRESEVLGLVEQGRTNRQIADALVVSRYTVNSHIRSIFFKMHATNRAEAVAHALGPSGKAAQRPRP